MVDIEKERAAFEAWHGGVYRGLYEDIAWAAWKQRAAPQPAPEPESVPIPTTVNMARMMLTLGYKYLQENAPQHLTQPAPIPARTEQEKLARAERALLRGGFQDLGGQEWKPPVNEVAGALHRRIFELENQMTDEAKDAARYRAMKENDFTSEYCDYISDCLNEREKFDLDAVIDAGQAGKEQE